MKTKQSQIIEIIAEHLCISEGDIGPGTELTELGADSLDHVEIIMAVEEEFDVSIPDGESEKLTTVDAIVKWLEDLGTKEVAELIKDWTEGK